MEKYLKLLKKANKIALFVHVSPDPDAIGSVVGFAQILEKLGKSVHMFSSDEIADNYYFLDKVKEFNPEFDDYDLLVAVDTATMERLGIYKEKFETHPNTLRIDHHPNSEGITNGLNICIPYSATAVIVLEIAKKLKVKLDKDIATALYFGICGDTGIFKNNNTDPMTFRACAELLDAGAEIRKVYSEFFEKKTVPYVKLTSYILMNAETYDDYGFAVMKVKADDYEKFGTTENESVNNLAHQYLNCGYKIAVTIKEKHDGIRCSFRSKFEYDVDAVARTLGGGGHKNAAGADVKDTLENTEKKVIDTIKTYLENYEKKGE